MRGWDLLVRFVTAWNRDRWELVVLSIPFTRAVLYAAHLAPAQLNDEVIRPLWQVIALIALGASALIATVGVLRERPIIERAGLHILGPLAVLYGLASAVSDWHRGLVTFAVYTMIAACCFARAHEITKAMRIVNRTLEARTGQQ